MQLDARGPVDVRPTRCCFAAMGALGGSDVHAAGSDSGTGHGLVVGAAVKAAGAVGSIRSPLATTAGGPGRLTDLLDSIRAELGDTA
jgi:hypothetical protein